MSSLPPSLPNEVLYLVAQNLIGVDDEDTDR